MSWTKRLPIARQGDRRVGSGVDLLVARATEAQRREDWAAARALWQEVTEREPARFNAWLQLGNMLNELGEHDNAIAVFRTALDADPDSAEPDAGIAGVLERAGRWEQAYETWQRTALALSLHPKGEAPEKVPEKLAHALLHAAMSAIKINRPDRAEDALLLLKRIEPAVVGQARFTVMHAQAVRMRDRKAAVPILRTLGNASLDDPAAAFEVASVLLDGDQEAGDQETGLAALQQGLRQRPSDLSFLWLAADLNERLGRWTEVMVLCERMDRIDPAQPRFLRRGFDAALKIGNLPAARRLACQAVRRNNLEPVHALIEPYRADGQLDRARLLCRWLRRRWPHSRWHATEYVILIASSGHPDLADRLVRDDVARNGRTPEMTRAYAEAAFRSGDFAEAVRRLRFFLELQPEDESAPVLLGYALANAVGIDAGERHFAEAASRQFQGIGPLTGLAHMAMRRRDRGEAFERWRRVTVVHPDWDIGHVELARSAYELRRNDLVREICSRRLAIRPRDATMGEFYAWFLVATGRHQEAWDRLQHLLRHHRSWTVMELLVQAAAGLGRLGQHLPAILELLPQSTTREAGRRLYHVVRLLEVAGGGDGGGDRLRDVVDRTMVDAGHLGWLFPYLGRDDKPGRSGSGGSPLADNGRGVERAWRRAHDLVRGDLADRIRNADADGIRAILDGAARDRPVIHVVNAFEQVSGGSELHALDIAGRLSRHAEVRLWAPEMPHPHFSARRGVRAVSPGRGDVPRGGVLVLVGVYFEIAPWLAQAGPERVVFLYNTFEAPLLFQRVQEVWDRCGIRAELLFCSDMMGAEVGLPGLFEPSPTDIASFSPRSQPHPPAHRFTLGRHSRDVAEKHHPEDWKVYEAVSACGGRSEVLGGTCMRASFPPIAGLDLLPARSSDMAPFLHGLDCYFYRTSTWVEPWGRVVLEAMACGLPVVAGRLGGYAEVIRHGENGYLFDTTEEACALVRQVCQDTALRARLGAAARRTAEALLGEAAMDRLISFYLVGQDGA